MSLVPLFQWLAHLPPGLWMRDSKWGFAIVEIAHLLGLAVLGGVILIVDLSLLGIGFRRQSASNLACELSPLFLGSLVVMVISGVLLVSAEAMKCYYHPAFRLKMLLFALALTFSFTLHRRTIRQGTKPLWSKAAAIVSLALWLGVGLAGRAIGFL